MATYMWSVAALAGALLLAGCGGTDSDDDNDGLIGFLQVANAVTDAPALTVELTFDDEIITATGPLAFRQGSAVTAVAQNTYAVSLSYLDQTTDTEVTLLSDVSMDIWNGMAHTVVIGGTFAAPTLTFVDSTINDLADTGNAEVAIANVSSDTASVYLSAPASGLSGLLATVTPGSHTEPLTLEEGTYALQLTPDGAVDVMYRSAEFSLVETARRIVVITDPAGADPAAKSAFLLNDLGAVTYQNLEARAALRVVNLVADAPSGSITVSDPTGTVADPHLDESLAFAETTGWVLLNPGFVSVAVVPEGFAGAEISTTVSVGADDFHSVVVAGSGAEQDVALRAAVGSHRPIDTQTNVLVASALAETDVEDVDQIDVYFLSSGESLGSASPVFSGIGLLEHDNAMLPVDNYDVVITTTGTQSILAGPTEVTLPSGGSVMVLGAEAAGGGRPFQIITVTDVMF